MATPSTSLHVDERIRKLERQLRRIKLWVVCSVLVAVAIVGIELRDFGFHLGDGTLELHKVLLTDPSGHILAVIGVGNAWHGVQGKTYYPGIQFRDEKGQEEMLISNTDATFRDADRYVGLGFTSGLEINDARGSVMLNPSGFSYVTNNERVMFGSYPNGLSLTVGNDNNRFGVVTDNEVASMYVASPKWEFDIQADNNNAEFIRGRKTQ